MVWSIWALNSRDQGENTRFAQIAHRWKRLNETGTMAPWRPTSPRTTLITSAASLRDRTAYGHSSPEPSMAWSAIQGPGSWRRKADIGGQLRLTALIEDGKTPYWGVVLVLVIGCALKLAVGSSSTGSSFRFFLLGLRDHTLPACGLPLGRRGACQSSARYERRSSLCGSAAGLKLTCPRLY